MPDNHYDNPELAVLYDAFSGWSKDRDFYVAQAGETPLRIVDFGCGTGLICSAYAKMGHAVTGVDPSPTMLDLARKQPQGEEIEWVRSSVQDFSSSQKFDLAIMTGHAFQVLLTDSDIVSACSTVKNVLAPGGRFVFESRNPRFDWASRWNKSVGAEVGGVSVRESSHLISFDGKRLTFELHYDFPDRRLVSPSELRFSTRGEIEALLAEAGLFVERVYGDWDGSDFVEDQSKEIIFEARAVGR